MSNDPPSRSLDKFIVRLPSGMRERLAQAAERAGRSMNAEVVYRLAESFQAEELGEGVTELSDLYQQAEKNPDHYRRVGKAFMEALQVLRTEAESVVKPDDGTSYTLAEAPALAREIRRRRAADKK